MTNLSSGLVAGSRSVDPWVGYCGRVVLAILVLAAMMCSVMAIHSCDFFSISIGDIHADQSTTGGALSVHQYLYEGRNGFIEPPFELHLGLFRYTISKYGTSLMESSNCRTYDGVFIHENLEEQWFALSRFFAIVAPLVALLGSLVALLEVCCVDIGKRTSRIILCTLYTIAFGCQSMTFSMFLEDSFCNDNIDDGCQLSDGGKLSIISCMLYLVATLFICRLPRPQPYFDTALSRRKNERSTLTHTYSPINESKEKPMEDEDFGRTSSVSAMENGVELVMPSPEDEADDAVKDCIIEEETKTPSISRAIGSGSVDHIKDDPNLLYEVQLQSGGLKSRMDEISEDTESHNNQVSVDTGVFVTPGTDTATYDVFDLAQVSSKQLKEASEVSADIDNVASEDKSDIASEASVKLSLEQCASILGGENPSLLPTIEANPFDPEQLLELPTESNGDPTDTNMVSKAKDDNKLSESELAGKNMIRDYSSSSLSIAVKATDFGQSTLGINFWMPWRKMEVYDPNNTSEVAENTKSQVTSSVEDHKVALFNNSTMVSMADHSSDQVSGDSKTTPEGNNENSDKELSEKAKPDEILSTKEHRESSFDKDCKVALFVDSFINGIVDYNQDQQIKQHEKIDGEISEPNRSRSPPIKDETEGITETKGSKEGDLNDKINAMQGDISVETDKQVFDVNTSEDGSDSTNGATAEQQIERHSNNNRTDEGDSNINISGKTISSNDKSKSGIPSGNLSEDASDSMPIDVEKSQSAKPNFEEKKTQGNSTNQNNDEAAPLEQKQVSQNRWPVFTEIQSESETIDTKSGRNEVSEPETCTTSAKEVNDIHANESDIKMTHPKDLNDKALAQGSDSEGVLIPGEASNDTTMQPVDDESPTTRKTKKRFLLPWRPKKISLVGFPPSDCVGKIKLTEDTPLCIGAKANTSSEINAESISISQADNSLHDQLVGRNMDAAFKDPPVFRDNPVKETLYDEYVDQERVRGINDTTVDANSGDKENPETMNAEVESTVSAVSSTMPLQAGQKAELVTSVENDNLSTPSDEVDENATISSKQSQSEENGRAGTLIKDLFDIVSDGCKKEESSLAANQVHNICNEQKEQSGCTAAPKLFAGTAVLTEPANVKQSLICTNALPLGSLLGETNKSEGGVKEPSHESASAFLQDDKTNEVENDLEALSVGTISTDDSTAHGSAGGGSLKLKESTSTALDLSIDTDDGETATTMRDAVNDRSEVSMVVTRHTLAEF